MDSITGSCCHANDSEIFEEWIAHCIRKHVKGGTEPKMTKDQCLAAAYGKLRKGEVHKKGDSLLVIMDGDTVLDVFNLAEVLERLEMEEGK